MTPALLLAVNAAATWYLTGLIWVIQVVHYPLFSYTERTSYSAFAAAHGWRISLIVGPAMVVELVTAGWLIVSRPATLPVGWAWVGAGLVALIWLSTAAVQVPLHAELARGYDAQAHASLVTSNWARTLAWTARSVLLLVVVVRSLQSAN